MAGIEVEGLEQLQKKLLELGRKGSAIENNALKKAAEPILNDAKAKAPVLTGKGRAELKISNIKKQGGTKYVLVGIDKGDISDIFYMKFQEFGTSKMSARPFLSPAYERNKSRTIEILKDEFKKGLGIL